MNLSKISEIQGSPRLRLNTTFLFCSPLTLRRSCVSLNFCPCLPATFKSSSLSCCPLFASFSPIILSSILPQAFFSFLFLSKSMSLLLMTPHPTPPPLFPGMGAEEALLLQEPNSSWWNLAGKNHRGQVAGPGHPPRHRTRGKVVMKTRPRRHGR